jgi:two-component system chemotaxis sensor kinase CheA
MTLAIVRCLIVRAGGRDHAIPLSAVTALLPGASEEVSAEGSSAVWVGAEALPITDLGVLLGAVEPTTGGSVAVIATATARRAFRVQDLIGQRDVVVKDLGRVLPRLDLLAGASVEPDGSVMLVLDAQGILDAAAGRGGTPIGAAVRRELPGAPAPATILVVDDAMMIRELLRAMLDRAGYDVIVAPDGQDALELLPRADLVITDVEMPGMGGVELTRAIRAAPEHAGLPILMLTTRASEEDRRRGMEAGCDGYLVKRSFDEHALLDAIRRLLETRAER